MQGVALACWAYDLATTFYAINIWGLAYETNPLGWPLGAAGALAYYAPTVIFTYVLLFRIKQTTSLYAAVPMTVVALLMGFMNLNAGIGNYQFFIVSASVPAAVRYNLLAVVLAANLFCAATLATSAGRQVIAKQNLGSLQNRLP